MNISDQVLAILNSNGKEMFLVTVGQRLGISTRDAFSKDASQAVLQARACNEMMIAIWSQIWSTKEEAVSGYPDTEFLSILLEKADMGDARSHLKFAIESALSLVDDSGIQGQK